MTVDFGAHIYPESVFPEPLVGSELEALLGPTLSDPDTLRRLYDASGVDGAVLSQPYYMGSGDVDATVNANDALLDLVEQDDGFYGLAAVPVSAGGDAAAAELERSLDNGYHGGAVETKTNGHELTDEALEPVFEVASQTGAPLLVHPKLNASLHPEALDDDLLLNATFGREVALCESICKVIHSGLLDQYPDLNLVFHHFGGNIASMLGRIHLQLDEDRWPGQDHVKDFEEFKAQFESRIYIDTSGFFGYDAPLATALDALPASNVLFGTDYPFEPRDEAELSRFVDTVERVAPENSDRILDRNARELLVNV